VKRLTDPPEGYPGSYERPPWAVVISSPEGHDHWTSHFFAQEADARAHLAASKAHLYGYSVSLYQRVD
jgi:hypothetical protein